MSSRFRCIIGGMFVNVLGCRLTTIIGGLVACLGLVISFFATSIFYLYISFGITLGFATTLQFSASINSVCECFTQGRAMTLALLMMALAVGGMLHPLLFEWLTGIYNWRGALLVMAGLMLNICVLGSLMMPLRISKQTDKNHSIRRTIKSLIDTDVLKSKPYMIYLLARFTIGFGLNLIYALMVDLAISKDYSRHTGLMLLLYYNVGNICGRFLACLLQIKQSVRALDLHIISTLVLAATYLIYPLAETFDHLLIVTVFSGVSHGVTMGTLPAIPAQLIDPKLFPTALGLQMTAQGASIIFGGPLTGWITDKTGSYNWSLISIGCCVLLGVALCVGVRTTLCRRQGSANITPGEHTLTHEAHINPAYTIETSTPSDLARSIKVESFRHSSASADIVEL